MQREDRNLHRERKQKAERRKPQRRALLEIA